MIEAERRYPKVQLENTSSTKHHHLLLKLTKMKDENYISRDPSRIFCKPHYIATIYDAMYTYFTIQSHFLKLVMKRTQRISSKLSHTLSYVVVISKIM